MADDSDEPSDIPQGDEPVDLPDLSRVFKPYEDFQKQWASSIGRQLAQSPVFRLHVSKMIGKMNADLAALSGAKALHGQINKQLIATSELSKLTRQFNLATNFQPITNKIVTNLFKQYNSTWRKLFESIGDITARIYPENLRELRPPLEDLETLLVDEGIPLMWVPGAEIAEVLLAESDAPSRRRVMRQRWKGIVTDCESVINKADHPELRDAQLFALDCVRALREGHSSAAQALAANLLDSLMNHHFDKQTRVKLTKNEFKQKGIKFNMDDYRIRAALTFAPVWYAYAQYWPQNGDPIPREFGRHPSAHGVSRRQYTRINGVIGLMLATSVLRFFDMELPR